MDPRPAGGIGALAHPLVESSALPLPPVVVATLAALLVAASFRLPAAASRAVPGWGGPGSGRRRPATGAALRGGLDDWRPAWTASRLAVVALLAAATVAGRAGVDDPAENLAPVLVVGIGWPLVVAGCLLAPGLWAWLDPWDALARALESVPGSRRFPPGPPAAADVRPAAVAALAWVWFLGGYGATFSPRAVGAAVALYTLATLAGCLLLGRAAWLGRFELFGLLGTWCGLLRRGGLVTWQPPRGVATVLGVLGGGLVFGALRLSGMWFRLAHPAAATAAVAAAGLAGAALLHGTERLATRRGAPGAVAAAAVPAVASLALAVALTNDRLWLAAQLLPALLDDPLGRGWELLGGIEPAVRANPLGAAGLAVVQVGLLTAGGVAGALVARSRGGRVAAAPAVAGLTGLLAAGVLAVTAV